MKRISSNMTNNDMQYHLRNREFDLNTIQNKMATQSRIQNLRDDPVAAAHSSRYRSFITRLERFSGNVDYAQSNHRITEGHVRESVDILQRVRELAVQGANGTYSRDDLRHMGREVDQLLNQMVQTANARNGDGTAVFSGDKSQTLPFRAVMGKVPGADGQVVTGVEYLGSIKENYAEVSDGAYLRLNYAGNQVFWAENQQLFADRDALDYQVSADSSIMIDGSEIKLTAGDTVHAVIAKINSSGTAVRSRLDPIKNSIVLETSTPHQLWLQEGANSSVLTELGLLKDQKSPSPGNLASSTRVFGGSAFDMVINLRDTLLRGDTIEVGGSALRGMDNALNSLLSTLGNIGAQGKRLEITAERLSREIPDMVEMNSHEADLDLTQAATELKMLEYTHKAALATAGRIMMPTLLDFLR
jgi:flagellar hook-associated protein 3 FlgL